MALIHVALLAVLSAFLSDAAHARSHILLRGGKRQSHKRVQNIDTPAEDEGLDLMNQVAGKMNYDMNPAEDPEAVYEATEQGEELKEGLASHVVDTPSDVLSALGSSYAAAQETKTEAMKTTAIVRPAVRPMKKIADAVVRAAAEHMNEALAVTAPVVAVTSVVATAGTQATADAVDALTTIDAAGLSNEQDATVALSSQAAKALVHKLPASAPADILSAASKIVEQGHAAKKKIASLVGRSGQVQHKVMKDDVEDEEESEEKEADVETEKTDEVDGESASDESADDDAGSEVTETEQSETHDSDAASDGSAEAADSEETSSAEEATSDADQSGQAESDDAVSGGSVDAEDESATAQENEE